jgi:hypothetical protein|tara:strand:- start:2149 stop:2451 length:303 start_codon:yes stop_codon:yes gene_type:complete
MKYLLAAASALLVLSPLAESPAMAHKAHRFNRQYQTGRHWHRHCHDDGVCHTHTHTHYGKDAGHHGRWFMHGLYSGTYPKYEDYWYPGWYPGPEWQIHIH